MQEMKEMWFNPWFGKIPWSRHGNPLQYSCLGNSMDRGASWATVHGITKESDMTEKLIHIGRTGGEKWVV